MADETGDDTPATSSSPPPPARRTRRSAESGSASATAKRKPGPKPGSTRSPRKPATPHGAVETVAAVVEPKVRKARQAVKATAETVTRKAPQAKTAMRAAKTVAKKAEGSSALRKGLVLGAVAAAASVVAGVVTLGRARKPVPSNAKAPEPKVPTTSAD